jgi:predicted DCC family thiol-disulfide oxidoreductase YuxK
MTETAKPPRRPPQGKVVVFFDGLCPLCDGIVRGLLARDKKRSLLFAPLQGQTALEVLGGAEMKNLTSPDTVIAWDQEGFHFRSSAMLRILTRLGGPHKLWAALYVIPAFLRDAVYNWIASNRRRWFGKLDACRTPTESQKDRFLP